MELAGKYPQFWKIRLLDMKLSKLFQDTLNLLDDLIDKKLLKRAVLGIFLHLHQG